MTYIVDGNEYQEDDLEVMEDDELKEIKLIAEKAFTDQKIILGRGKVDYANGGNGLTPLQYSRAKNIQNEAEGLIKCIDLILMEREQE
jgi:hypothetical protein